MKYGDIVYIRYVGNIRHWNRNLFQAQVTWVGANHFSVEINGQLTRFEKVTLRHDNRGHHPAYQLFLTVDAYRQELELNDLKTLMARTKFTSLPVDKQRAIKAIIEA